jgi:hypothetical protein
MLVSEYGFQKTYITKKRLMRPNQPSSLVPKGLKLKQGIILEGFGDVNLNAPSYSCPSGQTLNPFNNTCIDSITGALKGPATQGVIIGPATQGITAVPPTAPMTTQGAMTVATPAPASTVIPTSSSSTYTCPAGETVDINGVCQPTSTVSNPTVIPPTSSCAIGQTVDPNTGLCVMSTTSPSTLCPNGQFLLNGSCVNSCPTGYAPDSATGLCISSATSNSTQTSCPNGQSPDPTTGVCSESSPSTSCGSGQSLNIDTGQCQASSCPPTMVFYPDAGCDCPSGQVYNTDTLICSYPSQTASTIAPSSYVGSSSTTPQQTSTVIKYAQPSTTQPNLFATIRSLLWG